MAPIAMILGEVMSPEVGIISAVVFLVLSITGLALCGQCQRKGGNAYDVNGAATAQTRLGNIPWEVLGKMQQQTAPVAHRPQTRPTRALTTSHHGGATNPCPKAHWSGGNLTPSSLQPGPDRRRGVRTFHSAWTQQMDRPVKHRLQQENWLLWTNLFTHYH